MGNRHIKYTNNTYLGDYGVLFIEEIEKNEKGRRIGRFKCHCGNIFNCRINSIESNHTKSCGCIGTNNIHNLKKHPAYDRAKKQWDRCHNKNNPHYSDYSKRGTQCDNEIDHIKMICKWWDDHIDEWFDGASIDRIDNNIGYYYDNLRFADDYIQGNNQKKNLGKFNAIQHGSIVATGTISKIAKTLGMSYSAVYHRYTTGYDSFVFTKIEEGNL